jgi:hypothetical protein
MLALWKSRYGILHLVWGFRKKVPKFSCFADVEAASRMDLFASLGCLWGQGLLGPNSRRPGSSLELICREMELLCLETNDSPSTIYNSRVQSSLRTHVAVELPRDLLLISNRASLHHYLALDLKALSAADSNVGQRLDWCFQLSHASAKLAGPEHTRTFWSRRILRTCPQEPGTGS